MPLVNIKNLDIAKGLPAAGLYVLFGDGYLVNQVLKGLLDQRGLAVSDIDTFYGNDDREVTRALAAVNTYPLLGEGRLVLLRDADFLSSAADKDSLLESAQKAWEDEDAKTACKYVLSFLSLGGLDLADVLPANKSAISNALVQEPFFDEVVALCQNQNLKPQKAEQGVDLLFAALENGLPEVNTFIITTGGLDKRKKVFKALEEKALVVDCSVPQGDYKADKDAQNAILSRQALMFEEQTGKKIDSKALSALTSLIGFDMYAVSRALPQLADYAGDRKRITEEDVKVLFSRTKSDHIYELTSAVAARDLGQSLFYIESLLQNGKMFPLQILAAIANQMRKLTAAQSFLLSRHNRGFNPGLNYQAFQRDVLPQINAADDELLAVLLGWDELLAVQNEMGAKAKKTKKSDVVSRDFLLAKDGKSVYPLYFLLKNAAGWRGADPKDIFRLLLDAERELKMSPANPKLLLEKLLLDLFACAA